MASRHVVIIGAGIVGASIAWRLSQTGVRVTIIDAFAAPGRGVSSASFGWITCAAGNPDIPASIYWSRLDGIADYAALDLEFGGRLCTPSNGALVWGSSETETLDWAHRHAAMGSSVRVLSKTEICDLEPMIAEPPALAAHFPQEKAVDVPYACEILLRSAVENGARTVFSERVCGLVVSGGRIAGVRLSDQTIAAGRVIVAAGGRSPDIVGELMPEHGIFTSPAALITLSVDAGSLAHVVDGGGLEIRSRRDGKLIVASSVEGKSDDQTRTKLGNDILSRVRRMFPGLANPRVDKVEIADRPVLSEGRPLVSAAPNVDGLYLAVAHPGVILAPKISRLVAGMLA